MRKPLIIFFAFIPILTASCTTQSTLLGWAEDGPLAISAAESVEASSAYPLFSRALGRVVFFRGNVCINCGDFFDNHNYGRDQVWRRVQGQFAEFLRFQVNQSNIFAKVGDDFLLLNARLVSLDQQSSIGATAESKNVMTSDAVLTTTLTIRYELVDGAETVGVWNIASTAQSNSLAASTRIAESFDMAAKRNVRALLLTLISQNSPTESARASLALAQLGSEVDRTRTAFGYLLYGTGKTANAVGSGLSAVAQNSGAIATALKEAGESSRRVGSITADLGDSRSVEPSANASTSRGTTAGAKRRSNDNERAGAPGTSNIYLVQSQSTQPKRPERVKLLKIIENNSYAKWPEDILSWGTIKPSLQSKTSWYASIGGGNWSQTRAKACSNTMSRFNNIKPVEREKIGDHSDCICYTSSISNDWACTVYYKITPVTLSSGLTSTK